MPQRLKRLNADPWQDYEKVEANVDSRQEEDGWTPQMGGSPHWSRVPSFSHSSPFSRDGKALFELSGVIEPAPRGTDHPGNHEAAAPLVAISRCRCLHQRELSSPPARQLTAKFPCVIVSANKKRHSSRCEQPMGHFRQHPASQQSPLQRSAHYNS